MVEPLIEKQTTNMPQPISPTERLSITLRYLTTGNTFEDLKFVSAIAPQTIGKIVIETCEAIISCLHEYIKEFVHQLLSSWYLEPKISRQHQIMEVRALYQRKLNTVIYDKCIVELLLSNIMRQIFLRMFDKSIWS
ncbi:uncharacterized protein LOC119589929 [Penaeus monodon]|uniref:uncharacterized protein LOC119589929 n=1 Tax=Penaeus monodon TaxID=6687 RepID=UPI0018A7B740|nr:uncharacterized protein LOC119589929 [Penaeus monodon]